MPRDRPTVADLAAAGLLHGRLYTVEYITLEYTNADL